MSIGSGSSGNCFYLEINGKKLLIDAGLAAKTIRNSLRSIGTDLDSLDAVLISHTHSDHIKGLEVCRKYISCPLYMSAVSCAKLFAYAPVQLPEERPFEITDGIRVTAFETSHDCPGSIGFRFDHEGVAFGYVTDLGCVTPRIKEILSGCESLVIESNHDTEMLRNGPYPYLLKRRILSANGHLSNDDCAEAACFFAQNGTKHFFLAHLSRENNDPHTAEDTVGKVLRDFDVSLRVLPPGAGSLICIE